MVDESQDKMSVTIFTGNYQITGVIELSQRARLADYLAEAKSFIAVTQAEVLARDNHKILKSPFLKVHRDNIEMLPMFTSFPEKNLAFRISSPRSSTTTRGSFW